MEADISTLRKTGHFYFALTRKVYLSWRELGLKTLMLATDF